MTTDNRFELKLGDAEYPQQLLSLPTPPKRLFCIGDYRLLGPGLAIVGARRATPYGRRAARLFASAAASRGVPIVSGAAIGCDQSAQHAALSAGGRSVAVMGCGADVDYPKGAAGLLQTLRQHHLVVSENPWGTQPKPYLFAKRNWVIAGLAAAVLVVEAAHKSGTMGTAQAAAEMGRTVLAVPGSIFAPECCGTNRLLGDGATACADIKDLFAALDILGAGTPLEPGTAPRTGTRPDPLLNACLADPTRPDDLARLFDRDIVWVLNRLGELEAVGLLTRYPDGRYGPADNPRA